FVKRSPAYRRLRLAWTICFFQAEDGIRGRNVTGVQTCALPILGPAMVNAQQHMDAQRTWAIAVVCAIIAGAGFALLSLVELTVKRYHGGAVAVGKLDEPGERQNRWKGVLVTLGWSSGQDR